MINIQGVLLRYDNFILKLHLIMMSNDSSTPCI